MGRFVLVGKIDDTYFVRDTEDNSVDPLTQSQVNHAIGLGVSIDGVHPVRGARQFTVSEENFVPLGGEEQSSGETDSAGMSDEDLQNLQALQNMVAGIYSGNIDGDEEDDSFGSWDDEEYEDIGEDYDDSSEDVEELESEDFDDSIDDDDGSWEDDDEEDDDYDYGYVDDGDYWDELEEKEPPAIQKLRNLLTPEQKSVLAEYYMLRSRLSFEENITNNSALKNNTFNITTKNVRPDKKDKLDALRGTGRTWVYVGFVDMLAETGVYGYCTFGHHLRYKHIVIDANKLSADDILDLGDSMNSGVTVDDIDRASNKEIDNVFRAGGGINLDAIEQGAYDGNIIEFGSHCLADFFEVDPAVMGYICQLQTQATQEMEEMYLYYENDKVLEAMDSFKFLDEVMGYVIKDLARRTLTGTADECIVPKEFVGVYRRFVAANKSAVAEGKLPLIYPRSLVRILRKYISGIKDYNKALFQTSKSKLGIKISGINQIIKMQPMVLNEPIKKFLDIVFRANIKTWGKLISANEADKLSSIESFLQPNDKGYVPIFSTYYFGLTNSADKKGDSALNTYGALKVTGLAVGWLTNAFVDAFSGVYRHMNFAPSVTDEKTIYKLDGGNAENMQFFYKTMRDYTQYKDIAYFYFDRTTIEYNMDYFGKIMYLGYLVEEIPRVFKDSYRIRERIKSQDNSPARFVLDEDGNYTWQKSDYNIEPIFKEYAKQENVKEEYKDILRGMYRTLRSQYSSAAYLEIAEPLKRHYGDSFRQSTVSLTIDEVITCAEEYYFLLREALLDFDKFDESFAKSDIEAQNKALEERLKAEGNILEERMNAVKESLDEEASQLNLEGDTSTSSSNYAILQALVSQGEGALDNYTPVELATFASYLRQTQYKDAFETNNAGIAAKILETLEKSNFARVSDKQLYRIKQVLVALIPRLRRDIQ